MLVRTVIPVAACILLLWSCRGDESSIRSITRLHLEKVIDSLNAPAAVVYKDPRGLYAITGGECPCRVMVTGNQGVLIDSLVSVREGYYRSLQFPLSFLIGDSTVTELYARDIVHPSSNWQGQTPGRDTVVSIYQRLRSMDVNE